MPCCTSDYFPTVGEMLGIPLNGSDNRPYDGISLMPAITGAMFERSRPIAFQSGRQISLIDNRYKLYSKDRGNTWELYDLIDDPGEQSDLADLHPEKVNRMRKILEEWQASCKASMQGKDYTTELTIIRRKNDE
jgi:arylsulfatase A-like enzyme